MVEAGRTVEVHATLSARPIALAPIVVSVGSAYLERSGFYQRARRGGGALVTRRDLDRFDPMLTSDALARIPGVSLVRRREGVELVSRRQLETGATGPCPLLPYLDGIRMTDWDLDQVSPDALEAIEVYTGADTPVEYGSPFDANAQYHCGVVLFWTTRGG
jgi:outer membrane receptor protein involved in Fe transport